MNTRNIGGRMTYAALAASLAGCATVGTQPELSLAKTPYTATSLSQAPAVGTTIMDRAAEVFAFDLYSSSIKPDDSAAALRTFRTGVALLDLRCSLYLDALGLAHQRTANERRQVDLIGGFVAAISGLTGASAKQIAATSTAFSFTGSSMDAFTNAYLFSDASNAVTKLVRESQQAYLSSLDKELENPDYHGVVALLSGYEGLCRPGGIRTLVDEAVAAAKIVAQTPGAPSSSEALTAVLTQLMKALAAPVGESDAITLYAWFSNPSRRTAIAAQSPFLSALLAGGTTDELLQQKLAPVFLSLASPGQAIAKRWSSALPLVPGVAAPEAAGAAPSPLANGVAAPPAPPSPPSAAVLRARVKTVAPVVKVQP